MKLSDLLAANVSLAGQLTKIDLEITQKIGDLQTSIADLTNQLADAPLNDQQAASVQAVIDGVNALDAIVPDQTPV